MGQRSWPRWSPTDQKLVNTSDYAGPASGELTADQVQRFLRVQAHVKATLGARAEAFTEKYKELGTTRPDGTEVPRRCPSCSPGSATCRKVYLDARRAQVDALNTEKFSREEFSWVRLRVYQAAGIEVAGYEPRELERMIKGMASGAEVKVPEVDLPDAPAKNRELVKPYAKQIMEWLAMASFGL